MCHNCAFMCHNWGCQAVDSGRLWTQVSRGLLDGASRCFNCGGLKTLGSARWALASACGTDVGLQRQGLG